MSSASQSRTSKDDRAIPAPRQSLSTPDEGGDRLSKPAQLPEATETKAAHGARDELALASATGSGKQEREQRGLGSTPESETAASREATQAAAAINAEETAGATSQAAAPAGGFDDAVTVTQGGILHSETPVAGKMPAGGQQPAAPTPDAIQGADGSSSSGVQPPSSRVVNAGAGDAQGSATKTAQAVGGSMAVADVSQTPAESAGVEAEGDGGVLAESGATGTSQEAAEGAAPGQSQAGEGGAAVVKGLAATNEASPQLSEAQELQPRLPSEQGQHPITPATASQHSGVPQADQEPARSAEAAGPSSDQPSSADCASTPFAAAAQAAQPLPGRCASHTDSTPFHTMDIDIGQCKLVACQCCVWCEDALALSVEISVYVYMLKKLELLPGC